MSSLQSNLTRVTLRRDDAAVQRLTSAFVLDDECQSMAIHHKLLWTLFDDNPGKEDGSDPSGIGKTQPKQNSFLWRQLNGGQQFLILGPEPTSASPYFDVETRDFTMPVHEGQRLTFELRVNATVNRQMNANKGRDGRKRCDLVMDALSTVANDEREEQRDQITRRVLAQWLERQGQEAGGFQLDVVTDVFYRTVPLPKIDKSQGLAAQSLGDGPLMGVSDLKGQLTVTDPATFNRRLTQGLGRMKAFGCGLLLVRPVEDS